MTDEQEAYLMKRLVWVVGKDNAPDAMAFHKYVCAGQDAWEETDWRSAGYTSTILGLSDGVFRKRAWQMVHDKRGR